MQAPAHAAGGVAFVRAALERSRPMPEVTFE